MGSSLPLFLLLLLHHIAAVLPLLLRRFHPEKTKGAAKNSPHWEGNSERKKMWDHGKDKWANPAWRRGGGRYRDESLPQSLCPLLSSRRTKAAETKLSSFSPQTFDDWINAPEDGGQKESGRRCRRRRQIARPSSVDPVCAQVPSRTRWRKGGGGEPLVIYSRFR